MRTRRLPLPGAALLAALPLLAAGCAGTAVYDCVFKDPAGGIAARGTLSIPGRLASSNEKDMADLYEIRNRGAYTFAPAPKTLESAERGPRCLRDFLRPSGSCSVQFFRDSEDPELLGTADFIERSKIIVDLNVGFYDRNVLLSLGRTREGLNGVWKCSTAAGIFRGGTFEAKRR